MPYRDRERQLKVVRDWHRAHPEYLVKKKRGYRRRNREFLIRYANHHGCDECGKNTEYLYFTNGEVANRSVRYKGKACVSIETLKKEVDNRGLLCETCLTGLFHRGHERGF